MHGLLPRGVGDIVLAAMNGHEKLSLEVLDNVTSAGRLQGDLQAADGGRRPGRGWRGRNVRRTA